VGSTGIPQCCVWKTQTYRSSLEFCGPMARYYCYFSGMIKNAFDLFTVGRGN